MRYCHRRKCGSSVPPVARFCPRCGGRVKRGSAPPWVGIPLAVVGLIFVLRFTSATHHYSSPRQVPAIDAADDVSPQLSRVYRAYEPPLSKSPVHP